MLSNNEMILEVAKIVDRYDSMLDDGVCGSERSLMSQIVFACINHINPDDDCSWIPSFNKVLDICKETLKLMNDEESISLIWDCLDVCGLSNHRLSEQVIKMAQDRFDEINN